MNLLFTSNTTKTIKESIFNLIQNAKLSELTIAIAYNSHGETTKEFWSLVEKLDIPIEFYFLKDQMYTPNPEILKYTKEKDNVAWYVMSTGFHTKLVYGENVGLYVGSANITNSAMVSNFEIGIYEDYKKIHTKDLKQYINQLKTAAVRVAKSTQDKSKMYEDIKECFIEYKNTNLQSEKHKNKNMKFFPKPNKKTSYNIYDKKYTVPQRKLSIFFDKMFEVVYPMIKKELEDLPIELQYLREWEFSWLVDQILYNMARNWCSTIEQSIKIIDENNSEYLKTIKQYKGGYNIIRQRNFSEETKESLVKLAESSYTIQGRPHMKQETKFVSYVESWLKGSYEYTFQEVMDYFLDSDEDDLVVRFDNLCNKNSYKIENLYIGSLGDILGMALVKHPKYGMNYPISNNLIQNFVIENYS